MMQLKAIFSVLLRDYEFELAQPSETYRNDHSKMVVQLEQPCAVHRYRPRARRMRIVVDRDLCQGHAMCESRGARRCSSVSKAGDRRRCSTSRPPPISARRVDAAVQYCPTHALTIEED